MSLDFGPTNHIRHAEHSVEFWMSDVIWEGTIKYYTAPFESVLRQDILLDSLDCVDIFFLFRHRNNLEVSIDRCICIRQQLIASLEALITSRRC